MQRRSTTWRVFGPTDGLDSRARRILSTNSAVNATYQTGFRYIKKLTAHTSCVNALAWSSQGGRWLASAGDDRRILLWDMHQEDLTMPSVGLSGPEANVFELAFSASNKYLFSGGTDELVLTFNLARLDSVASPPTASSAASSSDKRPMSRFREHIGSIRGIAPHPSNDEVFLTAAEDGIIFRHDLRQQSSPIRDRTTSREFTGVQFHPVMDQLFVASAGKEKCALYDARMAFSSTPASSQGIVHQYVTSLTKRHGSYGNHVQPEASSITFDHEGKKLAITFLKHYPTIYTLNDPYPIAVLTGENLPSGQPVPETERTYRNSCTIKHGSFAGPGLEYYSAGSDDFRGYCWKLPDVATLVGGRREISPTSWTKEAPETIAFGINKLQSRCVPVQLDTPAFRLGGHKSIVNTVLMHPTLPCIATAGVERRVILHSPFKASRSFEEVDANDVRPLPQESVTTRHSILLALMSGGRFSSAIDPDVATIDLFDEILREDFNSELFPPKRSYQPDSSDESDSDSESEPRDTNHDQEMDCDVSNIAERDSLSSDDGEVSPTMI